MDKNLLDLLQAYSDSQEQKIAQLENFMTNNVDTNDKIVEMLSKMQSQIDTIQKNTDYILRHISYMQEEILTLTKKIIVQPQQEIAEEMQPNQEEIGIVPLDIVPEAPTPEIQEEIVIPQPNEEPIVEPTKEEPVVEEKMETLEPEPAPEPTPEPEKVEQQETHTINDRTYENGFSQSAPYIDDIKKALPIGDRFLLQRELFKGNPEMLLKTLKKINEMHSFDEAFQYINSNFKWDKDSYAYQIFVNAIKRRFQEH